MSPENEKKWLKKLKGKKLMQQLNDGPDILWDRFMGNVNHHDGTRIEYDDNGMQISRQSEKESQ